MKAYTDLQQSRELAEILPVESADMFLALNGTQPVMSKYIDNGFVTADNTAIPCWSLAALLDILPNGTETHKQVNESISCYFVEVYNNKKYFSTERYDDILDACVEMILKYGKLIIN